MGQLGSLKLLHVCWLACIILYICIHVYGSLETRKYVIFSEKIRVCDRNLVHPINSCVPACARAGILLRYTCGQSDTFGVGSC